VQKEHFPAQGSLQSRFEQSAHGRKLGEDQGAFVHAEHLLEHLD
jgi:hypothetical protein